MQVSDGPSPVIKALPVRNDGKSKHTIISLDHVTHRYGQGGNASPALDDISLDIEQGAFVGLIGRNGSGKTTLAKHLNGLIQPTQGIVTVDGLDVSKHSVGEMAAHVGFVFQNPDHQIFCSSTKEEIAFGPTALGLDAATVFKRVDEMMTLFDLHRYEDVSPATLGYGERRAVALSSVIAMRTPILVLDEPTTGLDPQTRRTLWDVVAGLRRDRNMTVFLTTHYMEEAADADYVILLDSGRVVGEGTPLALKNTYAGDHITLYGVEEAAVRALGRKYAPVQGGWRIEVENTGEATKLILAQPALFTDYEITKGNMDDVFLAATGKKLHGGAEV